jgi:predicted amidohydrolase
MLDTLNISLLQVPLVWQHPQANRDNFEKHLATLPPTDLIVLPEMFTTGFTMEAERYGEAMDGASLGWMAAMAKARTAVITGSLIIKTDTGYYNRLIWMRPDGSHEAYDKRHLFRMANEQDHYQAGQSNQVFSLKGWRVMPQICYDLRFPVWSRNTQAYDLLVYVANWPSSRRYAWQTLLRARAIENICYVAAVNRVGKDGHGYEHSGDSAVLDYRGEELLSGGDMELITTIQLDKVKLLEFRRSFPAHLDADDFIITGPEPGLRQPAKL